MLCKVNIIFIKTNNSPSKHDLIHKKTLTFHYFALKINKKHILLKCYSYLNSENSRTEI